MHCRGSQSQFGAETLPLAFPSAFEICHAVLAYFYLSKSLKKKTGSTLYLDFCLALSSTREIGEREVQGLPQLHKELEADLGYKIHFHNSKPSGGTAQRVRERAALAEALS